MGEVPDKPDVYMSGPLSAVSEEEKKELIEEVYEEVYDACDEIGLKCYCPHRADADPSNEMAHGKVWDIDYEKVTTADALVAYVSTPALGVGAEIEMAREAYNDIILLMEGKETENVSRLVTGNPAVMDQIQIVQDLSSGTREREALQSNLFKIFSKKTLKRAAYQDDWSDITSKEMKQYLDDIEIIMRNQDRGPSDYKPLTVDDWITKAEDNDNDDSWSNQSGQTTL